MQKIRNASVRRLQHHWNHFCFGWNFTKYICLKSRGSHGHTRPINLFGRLLLFIYHERRGIDKLEKTKHGFQKEVMLLYQTLLKSDESITSYLCLSSVTFPNTVALTCTTLHIDRRWIEITLILRTPKNPALIHEISRIKASKLNYPNVFLITTEPNPYGSWIVISIKSFRIYTKPFQLKLIAYQLCVFSLKTRVAVETQALLRKKVSLHQLNVL